MAETIEQKVVADLSWVKTHLILLAVVAVLAFGGIYTIESLIAKHDVEQAAQWQMILKQQQTATAAIQQQLAADEQHWTQVEAELLQQNANLAKDITARDAQSQQQVNHDATLSAKEAAQRIAADTKSDATAQADTVVLPLSTARITVADLDMLPVVQADLADTQKQLANETTAYNTCQNDVTEQKTLVAAEQKTLVDTQTADAKTIKALKAEHRKAILKAFGIGYVAGFVSGATVHLWAKFL